MILPLLKFAVNKMNRNHRAASCRNQMELSLRTAKKTQFFGFVVQITWITLKIIYTGISRRILS